MEHLYLLTRNKELQLSRSLVEHHKHHLTQVIVHPLPPTEVREFDWAYYAEKYLNWKQVWSASTVQKHWERTRSGTSTNPQDRRTLQDPAMVSGLLHVLYDAIQHDYSTIWILDVTQPVPISDLPVDVNHSQVSRFSNQTHIYAYCLQQSVLKPIFLELSNRVYNFDEVLEAYLALHQITLQSLPTEISDSSDLNTFLLRSNLSVMNDLDSYTDRLLHDSVSQFLQSQPSTQWIDIHDFLKYHPYQLVMSKWNRHLSLSPELYWQLCLLLPQITAPGSQITLSSFPQMVIKPASSHQCRFNEMYFDHHFYLTLYPCYRDHLKTAYESYHHFLNHGIIEHLWPNGALYTMVRTCQELMFKRYQETLTRILHPGKPELPETLGASNLPHSEPPLIYVLTRTCNREHLFQQCVQSLLDQHYPNLRHIVSYDRPDTLRYLSGYPHIYQQINLIPHKSQLHPNQYIDCLYDYVLSQEPGWVMVLDDDDKFMMNHALEYLSQFLTQPTSVVTWILYRNDKFIYPVDKQRPIVGEIGSCCYLYHTSMIQKGFWRPGGVGDFPFYQQLFNRTKDHIYVDLPLTGVNYSEQVSGWTAM